MQAAFESAPIDRRSAGDPDAVERLLGAETTAAMQAAVLNGAGSGRHPDRGGTSCLLLADAQGNAISLVQSVFNVFGAMVLDPATGILFNNRMQGFTHEPGQPNSVGPGRRPAHTLCPVLVRRGGRLRYALATPGGLSQTLTNMQVLNYLIDEGRDVAAAVELPRWCNTRGGDVLLDGEFPQRWWPILPAGAPGRARRGRLFLRLRQGDRAHGYGDARGRRRLPARSFRARLLI